MSYLGARFLAETHFERTARANALTKSTYGGLGLVGVTLGSARVGRLSFGFLTGAAINPSRMAFFRASLRARLMASDFSRVFFSEGFS